MGAFTIRRLRVLVICEDPGLMQHIYSGLPAHEYELFVTPYYGDSIRQAYELRPDAVLIASQGAPDSPWLESVESLRALSPVPIVAMLRDNEKSDLSIARGATACLEPPFEAQRIGDAIVYATIGSASP